MPSLSFVRPPFGRPHVATIAGLVVFAVTLWVQSMLNDGDTFWHLAAGAWMIDHHTVLKTDPFSYTFYGQPWMTHEWLSEVLMAVFYRYGGWNGLLILTAAALGLSAFMITRVAALWLRGLALWIGLFLALSLMGPHLLARPHILILPLLSAWTAELVLARAHDRSPSLWLLPVMTLWANMHGSFLFGLALLAVFALEAVITAPLAKRRATAGRWGGFTLAALVASLLTPHGLYGLIFPIQLMFMPGINTIAEWMPVNLLTPSPLLVALLATGVVLVRYRVKVPHLRALLLLGLLYLSLTHQRHEMMLGIVAILVLAEPLGLALRPNARSATSPEKHPLATAAATMACLLLITLRLIIPVAEIRTPQTPIEALKAVPPAVRSTPVLNDYDLGGYLIAHQVRPFIDGRTDMYGPAFIDRYYRIMRPDADSLKQALNQYHIGWTLLRAHNPAVSAMDALPGWRRLYADKQFVVHVRTSSAP